MRGVFQIQDPDAKKPDLSAEIEFIHLIILSTIIIWVSAGFLDVFDSSQPMKEHWAGIAVIYLCRVGWWVGVASALVSMAAYAALLWRRNGTAK